MICESFINILIIDDELLTKIPQQLIHKKKIDKYPVNILGIKDISNAEIKEKISCHVYNRDSMAFDSKTEMLISDFSLVFIDYQLENKKNGIEIKNYFYNNDIPNKPKLILLSGLGKDSIKKSDAAQNDLFSDGKFQGYLSKSDSHYLFQNAIYSTIDNKFKIEEFIYVKQNETQETQETSSNKPLYTPLLTNLFDNSSRIVSMLWISKETGQVAYLFDEGEKAEQFINEQDKVFLSDYNSNEDPKSADIKKIGINLFGDYGPEISFASFQLNYNLGSFIHQYLRPIIIENQKKLTAPDNALYLKIAFEERKKERPQEVNDLNKLLFSQKKSLIQLVSLEENNNAIILELGILVRPPKLYSENMYYDKQMEQLINIIKDVKFIHGKAEGKVIEKKRINNNSEYYKIKLWVLKTENIENDNLYKRSSEIIEDIYAYLNSIIKDSLDQSISIFDLIGPSIVGPSSSHTCGANRIGRVARKLIKYYLEKNQSIITDDSIVLISVRLHDSFRKTGRGHKTLNALPAGLLKDYPKDQDGTEKDKINIAKFPFDKWSSPIDDWTLSTGKKVKYNWLGYNNLSDSSEAKYDIPLPSNYPTVKSYSNDNKPDLHENAAAILVKVIKNGKDQVLDFDSDWNKLNLVLIGESIGGGKIQMKAVGGDWIKPNDELFANKWDFITTSGNGNTGYFFFEKSKLVEDKGIKQIVKPLNGTTFPFYEIHNIEKYPPVITFKTDKQNLTFSGFYDLKKVIQETKVSLLDLAKLYEFWHLTGINYSKTSIVSITDTDHLSIINEIREEAKEMYEVLKQSQEQITDFYSRGGDEFLNIEDNYDKLSKEKKAGFKNIFSAANFGAITAMTKNASSMKILAAPTGGASGVLPGVLSGMIYYFSNSKEMKFPDEEKFIDALLISGFLASISSNWVPPSGAALGCQAETGTGAAMGAAFACNLLGGNDLQIIQAYILALKNSLGLVCDPIAGRVNTPCIKRNGFKAVEAINAAFLSLSGVESFIPGDEILLAMRAIGLDMQSKYRETSEGGLAKTPTGLKEKYLNRPNYCHQL